MNDPNTFDPNTFRVLASLLAAVAAYLLVRHGPGPIRQWLAQQEQSYDIVLRRQLLMDVSPRTVMVGIALLVGVAFLFGLALAESVVIGLALAVGAYFVPYLVIRHMEQKRREKLEMQLVDGLTTLASGVRAGLNLVQAFELLEQNHSAPIKQEFGAILREYQMGMDLNQAMRNASDRINSPLYRLTFTAIEMHRVRGGDTGQSLDRIAESIRDIQRLEGKLDALTSQGRTQATMMAVMPLVFLAILYLIMPDQVGLLFIDNLGRLILLGVVITIALGFLWIRKIMSVDI
jgi:tight adherence protein B